MLRLEKIKYKTLSVRWWEVFLVLIISRNTWQYF